MGSAAPTKEKKQTIAIQTMSPEQIIPAEPAPQPKKEENENKMPQIKQEQLKPKVQINKNDAALPTQNTPTKQNPEQLSTQNGTIDLHKQKYTNPHQKSNKKIKKLTVSVTQLNLDLIIETKPREKVKTPVEKKRVFAELEIEDIQ